MAAELAASIVAAASTLHEQHTERKILRVIEDVSPVISGTFKQRASTLSAAETWRERRRSPTTNYPHELWLVWHEVNELHSHFPNHTCTVTAQTCRICSPFTEVKVPLAQMFAEGWTVEREIKPTADVSYLVLARTAPRPRPGPPTGGV